LGKHLGHGGVPRSIGCELHDDVIIPRIVETMVS
jgi:hypothetical protein